MYAKKPASVIKFMNTVLVANGDSMKDFNFLISHTGSANIFKCGKEQVMKYIKEIIV